MLGGVQGVIGDGLLFHEKGVYGDGLHGRQKAANAFWVWLIALCAAFVLSCSPCIPNTKAVEEHALH